MIFHVLNGTARKITFDKPKLTCPENSSRAALAARACRCALGQAHGHAGRVACGTGPREQVLAGRSGREARLRGRVSAHAPKFEIKSFFYFQYNLNMFQTSKIHINLNISPKFMIYVLLGFYFRILSIKNMKLNISI
jgi:hypothetical protein